MSKRENIKTTIEEIVSYWRKKKSEVGLSIDWLEADHRCWRCGCEKNLQRCHIVPHSLGGRDEAANLVLLCKRCHEEGPNVADSEVMWDWIKAYAHPFYGSFWGFVGMKEYELIYGHSLMIDYNKLLAKINGKVEPKKIEEMFIDRLKNALRNAGYHFGQDYYNNATVAGIYRMVVKSLERDMNDDVSIVNQEFDKSILE